MITIRHVSGPATLIAWPEIRAHVEAACGEMLVPSEIRRDLVFSAGGAIAWMVYDGDEHVATAVTQARALTRGYRIVVLTLGGRDFWTWAPVLNAALVQHAEDRGLGLCAYVRVGFARWLRRLGYYPADKRAVGPSRYLMEYDRWATCSRRTSK